MGDWTIRGRIIASFAALLIFMTLIAGLAYTRLARIRDAGLEQHSLPGIYYSMAVMAAHELDYSLTQGYALLDDPAQRQKQLTDIAANRVRLLDMLSKYEGTLEDADDRQKFAALKEGLDAYRRVQDEVLNGDRTTAGTRIEQTLAPEFERAQARIRTSVETERATADTGAREIREGVNNAQVGILMSFGAALVVAFICGYLLVRSIATPLSHLSAELEQSGIQVNTSVTELSATAKQQQVMATEVATTTLEIGATSKQISATSKELVRTMDEVSKVAEHSAALAGSGQSGLTQMEETMRGVMAAAGSVSGKLSVLNEKAGNIGQVVTTITKVADQTNLLSLNAAIEAEKAGEYGRGFAVVATEIRRLADQTAVATYDIEQMVKEIQSAVSAGVMSMDKFSEEVRRGMHAIEQIGGQLSQIIEQVQALAPRVESANDGMQAQMTGAEQISDALTQLSSAAQHTVESLRQSNQAIDELHHAASSLSTEVTTFKAKVA